MRVHRETLEVNTPRRGTVEITGEVQRVVSRSRVDDGLCTLFIHHTSASLIICENADPDVRRDLETFAARWVPDGDAMFEHRAEGPDDMPAHVRSVFTQTSLNVPVTGGKASLGTWQGVFVWEHRTSAHTRRVTVTVLGE